MSPTNEVLTQIREQLVEERASGKWKPEPSDPLYECDFLRVGFRSWGLEAPDKKWKLVLSRVDFGSSDPKSLLSVYAPGHGNSFGDLNGLVMAHNLSVNSGQTINGTAGRLSKMLGASDTDWARRLYYLIARSREANAGSNNGTFSTTGVPMIEKSPPFVFAGRVREGRTISLFGPGSAGKTTIADGLVASACSGTEVIPGWQPSRRYSCLVLDWDEGREEEEVRLAAICRAYGIALAGGYHYKRMSRPLHDVADELGFYVVANKIDIIVVSPMGRAQRDHGDNLTASVDEVYEILRSFATTNILIDHVTGSNMKGGAEREFGSVRKRDNARGSYSVYAQSEEMGQRVLVMRNTKPDALLGRKADQAVRVEYDPPEPDDTGVYERISFHPDQVIEQGAGYPSPAGGGVAMRVSLHQMLMGGHATIEELADATGHGSPSVKSCLYRYNGTWFSRLPSGSWEALPISGSSSATSSSATVGSSAP